MTRRDPPGRRKIDGMPTPDDLVDSPELAILAALDRTLDLVARTLACQHPEIADPGRLYWFRQASRVATAAKTLVDHTAAMKQAIIAYRETLEIRRQDRASKHPDDLPF